MKKENFTIRPATVADVPIILESRVDEAEINEDIRSALAALSPAGQLAVAGD